MKNKNYITILGWMVNELSLSGNDLICYAIIYGFSQDDNYWEGSQSYLSEWLGISKRATVDILKRLISDGHIVKQEYEVNKVKFCKYKAVVPNFMGSEESAYLMVFGTIALYLQNFTLFTSYSCLLISPFETSLLRMSQTALLETPSQSER